MRNKSLKLNPFQPSAQLGQRLTADFRPGRQFARQRHRAVPGDVERTSRDRLIAGHRRLAAVTKLGWTEVPVYVQPHLADDEKRALAAHVTENTLREPLAVSELVELGRQIEPQERAAARDRVRTGKGADGSGGRGRKGKPGEKVPLGFGKTRERIAWRTEPLHEISIDRRVVVARLVVL